MVPRGTGATFLCLLAAVIAAAAIAAAGCGSSARATNSRVVAVVAAENFWGNIAAQVGGSHAHVTSIVSDPSSDPHQYEATARDSAAVSNARLVIETGLGDDAFVDQLLSAGSGGARVLTVAKVLGVTGSGANPHLWYDVERVGDVARAIESELAAADPADASTFAANLRAFTASMQPLIGAIHAIETKYHDTPVAYTERVPEYLLADAGLAVKTPAGFARAVEEGNEPSPADTQAMISLVNDRQVRVLLYNAQATSATTQHVRSLARDAGIPVVAVTETMPPDEPTYQSWQLHQIQALGRALGA